MNENQNPDENPSLDNEEEIEFEDVEAEFDDDDEEWQDEEIETEVEAIRFEEVPVERNEERLSKLLSRAGIASRRAAEDLITAGRVCVNGHFVREPGSKADANLDRIVVDNKPVVFSDEPPIVIVFHKPRNVMTTRNDPQGRPTVFDLLPKKFARLIPIGRLDFDTSGVLLLTDDGDLVHLLTHPSHGALKTYEARVRGEVKREEIDKLKAGVKLEDGMTAPARARIVAQREKNALVELTLHEGRNRQVRRMLEVVGHPVSVLRRTVFAGVELEGLQPGEHRVLLPGEGNALRKPTETKIKVAKKPARPKPKPKIINVAPPKARPTRSGVAQRIQDRWKNE